MCTGPSAAQVIRTLAVDHKTAGARRDRGKIDSAPRAPAEHYVAAPGIAAGGGVAQERPDDQVGQAVAVDIACADNAVAAPVIPSLAVDYKAAGVGCDCGQVDRAAPALTEHHVAAPGPIPSGGIASVRPDDQVRQPVAVDVPGAGNTIATVVTPALAVDDEAAGACGDIG